jgi:hypothetical protein
MLVVLLASIAHADEPTVGDFLAASRNNPQDLMAIGAATNGIRTLNIYLDVTRPECEPAGSRACRQVDRRQSKVFCVPPKLALPPEQIADIAEKYLDKHPQDAAQPSGLYPLVILYSLIDTFPCGKKPQLEAMRSQ